MDAPRCQLLCPNQWSTPAESASFSDPGSYARRPLWRTVVAPAERGSAGWNYRKSADRQRLGQGGCRLSWHDMARIGTRGTFEMQLAADGEETAVPSDAAAAEMGWNKPGEFVASSTRMRLTISSRMDGEMAVADAMRGRPVGQPECCVPRMTAGVRRARGKTGRAGSGLFGKTRPVPHGPSWSGRTKQASRTRYQRTTRGNENDLMAKPSGAASG